MYDTKLKEYKEKQADFLEQMKEHSQADADFHITANTVLSLAQRACEIFERSEVHEKRALLNFLLQNCELEGKNLLFKLKTPFDRVLVANQTSNWLRVVNEVRTRIEEFQGYIYIPDLQVPNS